jgi:hypothetical protein
LREFFQKFQLRKLFQKFRETVGNRLCNIVLRPLAAVALGLALECRLLAQSGHRRPNLMALKTGFVLNLTAEG